MYGTNQQRTIRRWARVGLMCAMVALLAAPSLVEAQERTRERERNRESIFLSSPRVLSLRGSRIRLGVELDGNQSAALDAQGAWLESVTEGSPADEAGLREGDIITHVNGMDLTEPLPDAEVEEDFNEDESYPVQRLIAFVQEVEPGDEIDIRYVRDGDAMETTAVAEDLGSSFFGLTLDGGELELMPLRGNVRRFGSNLDEFTLRIDSLGFGGDSIRSFYFGDPDRIGSVQVVPGMRSGMGISRCPGAEGTLWISTSSCYAGVELEELNPELGEYFGSDRGVLVLDAEDDQPFGLRAGDVILSIDGREIEDVSHAIRILRSYEPDESVSLRIIRRGGEQTLEGTIR